MNYNASVSDFFKASAWKNNMLLGAVTMFIPIIGPLVLTGWHVTGLWARGDHEEAADFPPFDFQYFSKYLERGLWPFLVSLVSSLAVVPLYLCIFLPVVFFASSGQGKDSDGLIIGVFLGMMGLQFLLAMFYQIFVTPLSLRAMITQDFKSSFDLRFAKQFVALTWKELFTSLIFMLGLWLCLMLIAIFTCYIGVFFAVPIVIFSWHHLQKQLYQVHLNRGGQAAPLSPKLRDLPPPLLPS